MISTTDEFILPGEGRDPSTATREERRVVTRQLAGVHHRVSALLAVWVAYNGE